MAESPVNAVVLDAWSRFRERLRTFLLSRTASEADADDLLQDVLLKLHRAGDEVGSDRVERWLFATAKHALIDHVRRGARRRTVHAAIESGADETAEVMNAAAIRELSTCVQPFLRLLPEADRAILERAGLEHGSQARLARELDVPLSTIKSRVQRARAKLRDLFERCCEIELDGRGAPLACTVRGTQRGVGCCPEDSSGDDRCCPPVN